MIGVAIVRYCRSAISSKASIETNYDDTTAIRGISEASV
jgi:hypothetical protein